MQPRNVQTQSQSDWKVHLLVFFDLLVSINGWKMKLPLIARPIFRCKQVNVRECRLTISLLCSHDPYHQPPTFLQKNSIFEAPGHSLRDLKSRSIAMGTGIGWRMVHVFFSWQDINIRQTLGKDIYLMEETIALENSNFPAIFDSI